MSSHRVLVTSHVGSPDDPRTWSGTAAHLLQSLNETGAFQAFPHACNSKDWLARAAAALDRRRGLGHSSIPGPAARRLAARRTARRARKLECAAVLHLGTYDIGDFDGPEFIFVDNSFDIWERHAQAASRISLRQRKAFRRLESRALTNAAHVFTIGQHVAENMQQSFGLNESMLTAVGSGLGQIVPWHGPKDYSAARILIVAKLRPWDKGLGSLLDGLSRARETRPDINLTVIGGAGLAELRALPWVTATGWLSQEELQDIFNASTLFVMPARYEPWGLSYLEALVCRTPVMGLSHLALPEITDHGRFGFLLNDDDPATLCTAILDALADPQRLERMGREGQAACAAKYRWEAVTQRMSGIMRGLIDRGMIR